MATDTKEKSGGLPTEFKLDQNYPNPFNPSTTIEFTIPIGVTLRATAVRLEVFDILGRKVKTLLNKNLSAGRHKVTFDASEFSSGTYIYRLKAGDNYKSRKMVLLR